MTFTSTVLPPYALCTEVLSLRRGCLLVSRSHVHDHSLLPFQLHSYRAMLVVQLGVPLDLESEVDPWFEVAHVYYCTRMSGQLFYAHHLFHVARVHVHSLLPEKLLINASICSYCSIWASKLVVQEKEYLAKSLCHAWLYWCSG